MTIKQIQRECQKYNIHHYIINTDMSIDVRGNVNLIKSKLSKIPLLFNHVHGNFDCSVNQLTSLYGSPKVVYGSFNCYYNDLTTLEYIPAFISDDFICLDNNLKNIDYVPDHIGGDFYFENYIPFDITQFKRNKVIDGILAS